MNGMKALKISLIVVASVALIYFVVNIFFLGSNQGRTNFKKFSKHVAGRTNKSTEGTDKSMLGVDGITITLNGGRYHYMKADMSFKMKNPDDKKELEKNMDDVRDLILRYTSSQSSDKLDTEDGKMKYKENLKNIIYQTFGYKIQDIYFRNFVLAP